jgi:hypothetical protein
LKVEVRWQVDRVIKEPDGITVTRLEKEAIYRAQVQVENYTDTGDVYVHFFPEGRARVVVSDYSPDAKQHPIQLDDTNASHAAASGVAIKSMLTPEEIAELERKTTRERKQFGDWR